MWTLQLRKVRAALVEEHKDMPENSEKLDTQQQLVEAYKLQHPELNFSRMKVVCATRCNFKLKQKQEPAHKAAGGGHDERGGGGQGRGEADDSEDDDKVKGVENFKC